MIEECTNTNARAYTPHEKRINDAVDETAGSIRSAMLNKLED